ncbi:MAG: hypothetical protein VKL01_11555 [Limnothrix sp.]|nr:MULTISPECIES: hypothetical protein [unclassified Limnothrix]MEB3118993.1 hypothetical protein [Limnothrix sp.]
MTAHWWAVPDAQGDRPLGLFQASPITGHSHRLQRAGLSQRGN